MGTAAGKKDTSRSSCIPGPNAAGAMMRGGSSTSTAQKSESTTRTNKWGWRPRIICRTSSTSRSCKCRSSRTSPQFSDSNLASASAPPAASSISTVSYSGFSTHSLRNDSLELATRTREFRIAGCVSAVAIFHSVFLGARHQIKSCLFLGLGTDSYLSPISAAHGALVLPNRIEIHARNKRDSEACGFALGQKRMAHPKLRLSHKRRKKIHELELKISTNFF